MTTYAIHVTDADNGDLLDVEYAHESCVPDAMARYGDVPPPNVTAGAWPGGSETDYPVYCLGCGERMWHGLECWNDDMTKRICTEDACPSRVDR